MSDYRSFVKSVYPEVAKKVADPKERFKVIGEMWQKRKAQGHTGAVHSAAKKTRAAAAKAKGGIITAGALSGAGGFGDLLGSLIPF